MKIIKSDKDDIFIAFSKNEFKRLIGKRGRPELLGVTANINKKVIRIAVCLDSTLEKAIKRGIIKEADTQKPEDAKSKGQIKIVSESEGKELLQKPAGPS